jgi:hypothetical protein
VDSGTSYILIPKKHRDLFLLHLEQHKGIFCIHSNIAMCDCNGTADYPDLTFKI